MKEDNKYITEDLSDMTPLRAIRAKCYDCMGYQSLEVRLCPLTDCPLYPYRFGKDTLRKGRSYTEEERQIARERLQKYWTEKKGKRE